MILLDQLRWRRALVLHGMHKAAGWGLFAPDGVSIASVWPTGRRAPAARFEWIVWSAVEMSLAGVRVVVPTHGLAHSLDEAMTAAGRAAGVFMPP